MLYGLLNSRKSSEKLLVSLERASGNPEVNTIFNVHALVDATLQRTALDNFSSSIGVLGSRQIQPERGADPDLAIDVDVTTRLLAETEHHGQTKAGAFTCLLRGEERLEDTAHRFGRHSDTGIGYLDHHEIARCQLAMRNSVVTVQV